MVSLQDWQTRRTSREQLAPLVIHGDRHRQVAASRLSLEARRLRGGFGTAGRAMAVRRAFGSDGLHLGQSLASSLAPRTPMASTLRSVLSAAKEPETPDVDDEPILLPDFQGPVMLGASVNGVTFQQLLHHEMTFKLLVDSRGRAVAADAQMLATMKSEMEAAKLAKASAKTGGKKKAGGKKAAGGGKKKKAGGKKKKKKK